MYKAEGVIVPSTDFKHNQPTLDLLEKKSEGKPDSDERKEEKPKTDKKGKPAVDDSPKVPHLLKDPHMRETIQILVDYARMAKETWLADKK